MLRRFLLARLAPLAVGAGLVFTVGGVVYAMWKHLEWLLLVVIFCLIVAWGVDMFRRVKDIEAVKQLRESETKKRELLERKIAELPLETLSDIKQVIDEALWFYAHGGLVRIISFLQRMKTLTQSGSEFEVRQVEQTGGGLYFAVRLDASSAASLAIDDPFLLVSQSGSGVTEPIGSVFVHQVPRPFRNAVFFRLVASYRKEIVDSLRALARTRDIRGLKGIV